MATHITKAHVDVYVPGDDEMRKVATVRFDHGQVTVEGEGGLADSLRAGFIVDRLGESVELTPASGMAYLHALPIRFNGPSPMADDVIVDEEEEAPERGDRVKAAYEKFEKRMDELDADRKDAYEKTMRDIDRAKADAIRESLNGKGDS